MFLTGHTIQKWLSSKRKGISDPADSFIIPKEGRNIYAVP
jgi:hypothetical protein